MAERSTADLTLRELFTGSERFARELIDHLDHNFIPQVQHLDRLVRSHANPIKREEIQDITVRNQAATVINSDQFTQQLCQKIMEYLAAIDKAVNREIRGT